MSQTPISALITRTTVREADGLLRSVLEFSPESIANLEWGTPLQKLYRAWLASGGRETSADETANGSGAQYGRVSIGGGVSSHYLFDRSARLLFAALGIFIDESGRLDYADPEQYAIATDLFYVASGRSPLYQQVEIGRRDAGEIIYSQILLPMFDGDGNVAEVLTALRIHPSHTRNSLHLVS